MKRITSTIAASLLFVGCGSSGTNTTEATVQTGYLVDSAVANADYDCISDGEMNKTTASDGAFQCQDMSRVRFRIGKLILGEINHLPTDGYVFPQTLINVPIEDINDTRVIELAQLLQSLDADRNVTNGIQIPDAVITATTNILKPKRHT